MTNNKKKKVGRHAGSKIKKSSQPTNSAARRGLGRSAQTTNDDQSVAVITPVNEPKRKPGRPPGAKNKTAGTQTKSSNEPKRKPGRPPGAKNKNTQGEQSRGVGRPTKNRSVSHKSVETHRKSPGRPAGSKNNSSRGKGRDMGAISNVPSNSTSRAQELYDKKRGPGRPAGSQNRRSIPEGIQVMADVLIVNLDELNISSIYYKSSNGRTLKCLPLE